MKICRVLGKNRQAEYAIYRDTQIVPLRGFMAVAPDDETILGRLGEVATVLGSLDQSQLSWESRPRTLLPPVPAPEKIICIGLNYIPTLISHLSHIMTLKAGDLIFTGTPPGVGAARKPPRFLRDGDVCTVEVAGIGKLINRCIAEVAQD